MYIYQVINTLLANTCLYCGYCYGNTLCVWVCLFFSFFSLSPTLASGFLSLDPCHPLLRIVRDSGIQFGKYLPLSGSPFSNLGCSVTCSARSGEGFLGCTGNTTGAVPLNSNLNSPPLAWRPHMSQELALAIYETAKP